MGGFVLWVELEPHIDTMKLEVLCREKGVSFAPGSLFSATGKFRHCMRIGFSDSDVEKTSKGVGLIAEAYKEMLMEQG